MIEKPNLDISDGFVAVSTSQVCIVDIVRDVLMRNIGSLPLPAFRRQVEVESGLGFRPYELLNTTDPKVTTCRDAGFIMYRIENGIVHLYTGTPH